MGTIRENQRPSQGSGPVAGGDFLAYSCAAARDLHPLPNLRLNDEDARSAGFQRSETTVGFESNGSGEACQIACRDQRFQRPMTYRTIERITLSRMDVARGK